MTDASTIRFGAVALDCDDPRSLADFYAHLLGFPVAFSSDDFAALSGPAGLWLTMHRVAEHRPPSWPSGSVPKQIHLDLAVTDLQLSEQHALRAGARRADAQPAPDRFVVLLDPAGHPFCLTTQFPEQ